MKTYSLSIWNAINYKHPFPERTAYKDGRGLDFDRRYQVWSNRKAMAKSIRMQRRRAPRSDDWNPVIELSDVEGY